MTEERRHCFEGRLELPGPTGMARVAGCMFTVGNTQLPVAQGVYALVLRPRYPGAALS